MKKIEKQKNITEKVINYKKAEGAEKKYLYNDLFTELLETLENRAKNFIKSIDKASLLVDMEEYKSVAIYEGFHKAIESFDSEKCNNFMPYLYFCVDNALKSQVGRDKADKRKINEQAITFTHLVAQLGGQDFSDLDRTKEFVSNDGGIEKLINTAEEPEVITRFRELAGDFKADVVLCLTLEEDIQKEAICGVYGESEYNGKVRVGVCRIKKEFKNLLESL